MRRGFALAAVLLAGVAFADETRRLPVTVVVNQQSTKGILEIHDGYSLTWVVGNERHPIASWDSVLTKEIVEKLDKLAAQEEDARYRAVPYELTDGYKNAIFKELTLNVVHRGGSYHAERVALQFQYVHHSLEEVEGRATKTFVAPDSVRDAFDYTDLESYGIVFGENVLPARLVEKIEQDAEGEHGDTHREGYDREGKKAKVRITEMRARVVPLLQWNQRDKIKALEIYDVPLTSLVFLDPEKREANLNRLKTEGYDPDEMVGAERYRIASLSVDHRKDVLTQLKELTAPLQFDIKARNREIRESKWMEQQARAREESLENQRREDSARFKLLMNDLSEVDHDQILARLDEIRTLSLLPENQHHLVLLLQQYKGGDIEKIRQKIVDILIDSAPLHISTIVLLSAAGSGDSPVSGNVRKILQGANENGEVEAHLLKVLTTPNASLEVLSAARVALVHLPASGSAKHQLLNAMRSPEKRTRQISMIALAQLGPYSTTFLKGIVEALSSENGGDEAAELIIHLNPPDAVVERKLHELAKNGASETIRNRAALVLSQFVTRQTVWDLDVITAVKRCTEGH